VNTAADFTLEGNHDPDNPLSCAPFDATQSLREPVDSCPQGLGPGIQNPFGSFSTIYGATTAPTIGPFDPERFSHTLLSDRVVDAGDAPMPAAKEHIRIGGPTAAEPFAGAGALVPVAKALLYARPPSAPGTHNGMFFAPFYAAYLPATEAPVNEASGIDGPRHLNNGPEGGFLDCGAPPPTIGFGPGDICKDEVASTGGIAGGFRGPHDPYLFWLFAGAFTRGGFNDCRDVVTGKPLPTPTGVDHAIVYTDEHGKAEIAFNPDAVGFNRRIDSNGRCDPNPGGGPTINPLGVARITAEAKYPYKAVFQTRRVSNELVKNIISHEAKTLACTPKEELNTAGATVASDTSVICAETILDRFGQPVPGALVCFTATGDSNVDAFTRVQGDIDATGSKEVPDPLGRGRVCILTNDLGIAAVEVTQTLPILVDVKSENEKTRNGGSPVFRANCIAFSPGSAPVASAKCPVGTTPPPSGTQGTGGSQTTTQTGGTTQTGSQAVVSIGPAQNVVITKPATSKAAKAKAAYTIRSAKVVGRYLIVRVNGKTKTVRIRITLITKNGVTRVTRTIRTNRQVQVPNLRISRAVRTVKVSIA
jgi:hypothetical protein